MIQYITCLPVLLTIVVIVQPGAWCLFPPEKTILISLSLTESTMMVDSRSPVYLGITTDSPCMVVYNLYRAPVGVLNVWENYKWSSWIAVTSCSPCSCAFTESHKNLQCIVSCTVWQQLIIYIAHACTCLYSYAIHYC